MGLEDEKGYPRRGLVDSTDVQVDPKTRTVRWGALLANHDGLLMPRMAARVQLTTSAPYQAILAPEEVVVSDQGESCVSYQGLLDRPASARDNPALVIRIVK